jgi:diaminopimelate epimerase
MALAFQKYEGLGNDFLVVSAQDEGAVSASRAAALCDRHFGVGADGVLLVLPPRDPSCDVRMRVINADGSVPEMCGNGVRCVALYVARSRSVASLRLRVDTDAGPRTCVVDDVDGGATVTVDMGAVRALGDRALDVEGRGSIVVALAHAGNPHAVLFGAFGRGDVESLGPRIATHPAFPAGTNAEFATLRGGEIDLVVWERGVGITLACGTGACATVAAAGAKGLVPRGVPVAVHLPGGRLDITVAEDGRCTMKGPARLVFAGVVAVQG